MKTFRGLLSFLGYLFLAVALWLLIFLGGLGLYHVIQQAF